MITLDAGVWELWKPSGQEIFEEWRLMNTTWLITGDFPHPLTAYDLGACRRVRRKSFQCSLAEEDPEEVVFGRSNSG